MSDAKLRAEFLLSLSERLSAGAREYGNASFNRPVGQTAEEILSEVLDIAGWAYVLWVQLKTRLEALELAAGPAASCVGPDCEGCSQDECRQTEDNSRN